MTDRIVFTGLEDGAPLEAQGLEVVVAAASMEGGFGDDLLNADDDLGGDASTSSDDVYVEGRIITGENFDTSLEAQGLEVVVAATTTETSTPRADNLDVNGQGGSDVIIGTASTSPEGGEGFDFVQVNGSSTADSEADRVDIVTAAGEGGGPHVRVLDASLDAVGDGDILIGGTTSFDDDAGADTDFLDGGLGEESVGGADTVIEGSTEAVPFDGFSGGVYVTAADINGDVAATGFADAGTEANAFQRNNLGLFTLDIGTVEDPDADSFDFVDASPASEAPGEHIEIYGFSWGGASPATDGDVKPVLMVIASQDFYNREYGDSGLAFDGVDIVDTEVFESMDLF